jgi:hypothetical protein
VRLALPRCRHVEHSRRLAASSREALRTTACCSFYAAGGVVVVSCCFRATRCAAHPARISSGLAPFSSAATTAFRVVFPSSLFARLTRCVSSQKVARRLPPPPPLLPPPSQAIKNSFAVKHTCTAQCREQLNQPSLNRRHPDTADMCSGPERWLAGRQLLATRILLGFITRTQRIRCRSFSLIHLSPPVAPTMFKTGSTDTNEAQSSVPFRAGRW